VREFLKLISPKCEFCHCFGPHKLIYNLRANLSLKAKTLQKLPPGTPLEYFSTISICIELFTELNVMKMIRCTVLFFCDGTGHQSMVSREAEISSSIPATLKRIKRFGK